VGRILREANVRSDFTNAGQFLERAFDLLQGGDRVSEEAREAIGLLIEVMATREYSRVENTATILPFRRRVSFDY
jgi:hypothetical protein